jgi:hypothetical protein
VWGGITGTLSTQSDLQGALDTKAQGAASATDKAMVRFSGTTGKVIQNSLATVGDTGIISTPVALVANAGSTSVPITLKGQPGNENSYGCLWFTAAPIGTNYTLAAGSSGDTYFQGTSVLLQASSGPI